MIGDREELNGQTKYVKEIAEQLAAWQAKSRSRFLDTSLTSEQRNGGLIASSTS